MHNINLKYFPKMLRKKNYHKTSVRNIITFTTFTTKNEMKIWVAPPTNENIGCARALRQYAVFPN